MSKRSYVPTTNRGALTGSRGSPPGWRPDQTVNGKRVARVVPGRPASASAASVTGVMSKVVTRPNETIVGWTTVRRRP